MRGFTTLIAAVLFCAASLNAQGLGALSGSVTDPSGVAIPGAKVTVTEPATEFSRSVTTNEDGLYSIPSLRPAVYKLTVEAQGFRLFTESGRELLADQSATVNVKLESAPFPKPLKWPPAPPRWTRPHPPSNRLWIKGKLSSFR